MTSKYASNAIDAARYEWAQLLAATGNIATDLTSPRIECGWARRAIVRVDLTGFTRPDADETLDIRVQTSYNGGTDWADVEALRRSAAGAVILLFVVERPQSSAVARTETDNTLAVGSRNDLPPGTHLRVRFDLTDPLNADSTYAVNVEVFLQA